MRLLAIVVAFGALVAGTEASPAAAASEKESPRFRLATVVRSTEAAGTARIALSSTTVISGKRSVTKGRGVIDFTNDRSELTAELRDEDGDPQVVTARVIGGYIYAPNLSEGDDESATPPKPWLRKWASRGEAELALLINGDAAAGMQVLDEAGPARRVGTERVRGTPTVHYRFTPGRKAPKQVQAMHPDPRQVTRYDIWVDGRNRLRRFAQAGTSGKRTREVVVGELFDFGVPVDVVEPEPAQVENDEIDGLTGDWTLVRRGRVEGNTWRIYRAPTPRGSCFAHETEPPGPRVAATAPDQRGRAQDMCVYDRDSPDGPLSTGADLSTTAIALPNGMALLYGRVLPDEQRLTLRFADGHTKRLHPRNGMFAVALPANQLVKEIVTDIDGQKTRCKFSRTYPDFDCTDGGIRLVPG